VRRAWFLAGAALLLVGVAALGAAPASVEAPTTSASARSFAALAEADGTPPTTTGTGAGLPDGTVDLDSLPGDSLDVDGLAGDSLAVPPANALAADSLPGRHPAIAVGEKLTFTIRYGMIKAGIAVMEVVDRKKVGGRPAYHVTSTATSNSMFDGIYRVRDQVVSLMDEQGLFSLYFEKHLREGRYRADQQVRFDHARGVATYQDGREATITPGTFDVLAAFYRVRTMPLEPGQRFYLESHDNRKNYPLRVTVLKRERIETPAGTFDCLAVEPTLRSGAFFKNEGKLTIWLTDDARRMPVLMRSKLPIGAISVELIEYHRPVAGQ
jgi:hypothetical protein